MASNTLKSTRPELDQDGRIATDLTCFYCGYNLRGLLPGARCGECGQRITWSFVDSPLAPTDATWRARVQRATTAIPWLLPWLWLFLSWPFLIWYYVLLTTPEKCQSAMPTAAAWILRILPMLVFLVGLVGWLLSGEQVFVRVGVVGPIALSLLLIPVAIWIISARRRLQTIQGTMRLGCRIILLVVTLIIVGGAVELLLVQGIGELLIGVGLVLAVPAVLLLMGQVIWALGALRRAIEIAEIAERGAHSPLQRPSGLRFSAAPSSDQETAPAAPA